MPPAFTGGINIAIKIPPHEFETTVKFYVEVLALPVLTRSADTVVLSFGANRLHLDRVPHVSQAEVWLEVETPDLDAAARHLESHGAVRCDAIEPLPPGFPGFWTISPAGTVTLVTRSGEAE